MKFFLPDMQLYVKLNADFKQLPGNLSISELTRFSILKRPSGKPDGLFGVRTENLISGFC